LEGRWDGHLFFPESREESRKFNSYVRITEITLKRWPNNWITPQKFLV
jgi:hypothetical protein